jgi:hypothetical protein
VVLAERASLRCHRDRQARPGADRVQRKRPGLNDNNIVEFEAGADDPSIEIRTCKDGRRWELVLDVNAPAP